jgi:hypothetical protein
MSAKWWKVEQGEGTSQGSTVVADLAVERDCEVEVAPGDDAPPAPDHRGERGVVGNRHRALVRMGREPLDVPARGPVGVQQLVHGLVDDDPLVVAVGARVVVGP